MDGSVNVNVDVMTDWNNILSLLIPPSYLWAWCFQKCRKKLPKFFQTLKFWKRPTRKTKENCQVRDMSWWGAFFWRVPQQRLPRPRCGRRRGRRPGPSCCSRHHGRQSRRRSRRCRILKNRHAVTQSWRFIKGANQVIANLMENQAKTNLFDLFSSGLWGSERYSNSGGNGDRHDDNMAQILWGKQIASTRSISITNRLNWLYPRDSSVVWNSLRRLSIVPCWEDIGKFWKPSRHKPP